MPKVKMLRDISGAVGGHYNVKVGDVINVPDVVADDLCDRDDPHKLAERVKAAKKTDKKTATASAPEAASVSSPEAAMKPKAKPRDG